MLKGWTTGRLLSLLKWSEGRLKNFVAQRYEPLLRFDTTPVYDVTLASDTTVSNETPYTITSVMLGGEYSELWLQAQLPSAVSENLTCVFLFGDQTDTRVRVRFASSTRFFECHTITIASGKYAMSCDGTSGGGAKTVRQVQTAPVISSELYNGISIIPVSSSASPVVLPAGTQITIYAATHAVNTQAGVLNIGLASEAEVRALL